MKALLLDESTGDMHPPVISIRHTSHQNLCQSVANLSWSMSTHPCFTINRPANFPVKVESRYFTLWLADWAKLLGMYTRGTDPLPFYSLITHLYIEEIKHLWDQQPLFSCTHLLYNSISCSVFICIPYWMGIWEDGCYSKLHKGSFQSSLYQISLCLHAVAFSL